MTRRRRGALLIGLALALGGLAASDVGRREAAVRAQLAPLVDVVVAGRDLAPRRRRLPPDPRSAPTRRGTRRSGPRGGGAGAAPTARGCRRRGRCPPATPPPTPADLALRRIPARYAPV